MNSKQMVIASKYRLLSRVNGMYKEDGDKILIFEDRVVSIDTVTRANTEHRGHGNLLWVINEEETAKLDEKRESKTLELQARAKANSVTQDDLAEALLKKIAESNSKPAKKASKKKTEVKEENELESLSVEELKTKCDNEGIEYHHKAGKGKLIELLSK